MIIEHVFVTTAEATEALRLARDFLVARGFRAAGPETGKLDASTALSRGRAKASATAAFNELPQRVMIQWDRGRVTVAASVTMPGGKEPAAGSAKARLPIAMLTAIVRGLEMMLSQGRSFEESYAEWDRLEMDIRQEAASRRRVRIVLWAVAVIGLIAAIIGISMAVPRSGKRRRSELSPPVAELALALSSSALPGLPCLGLDGKPGGTA